MKKTDKTACVLPIVGAIEKVNTIIGPSRNWRAANGRQADFLRDFFTAKALAEVLTISELESIASFSADELNAKLAEWKFSIKLDKFPAGGFGTVCKLDAKVEWPVAGEVREIKLMTGGHVPGVFIKDNVRFTHSRRRGIIASLATQNGDIVRLASEVDAPSGLSLVDYVRERKSDSLTPITDYTGVHFPMVSLVEKPDISWLVGMETSGNDGERYLIAQALQETKFGMNQFGARAKSAVAIGMKRGMASRPKPPLVINSSFLVWIERPGLSVPLFVGFIQQEHMKDPGDLANM